MPVHSRLSSREPWAAAASKRREPSLGGSRRTNPFCSARAVACCRMRSARSQACASVSARIGRNDRLHGFNNLTKTLSFNIYDICYAETPQDQQAYVEYINKEYNAKRLTQILTEVAEIIGANILNIARQDYDPQGASVTILISEHPIVEKIGRDVISDAVVAHLDKSHITVH